MSQILPFCSPEPLVANSIQPQSYLQHYSTLESKEERQTDTTGRGPGGQRYTLLLEFLSALHHSIIVCIFQDISGGKTARTVDDRDRGDADETDFKKKKYFPQHHLTFSHPSLRS